MHINIFTMNKDTPNEEEESVKKYSHYKKYTLTFICEADIIYAKNILHFYKYHIILLYIILVKISL